MSDQPPPYDPEQPAPYPPYTPSSGHGSQQGYPGYPVTHTPYGNPPKKSHTTRNTLLIVGVVVLVVCGGLVAAVAGLVSSVESDYEPPNTEFAGSKADPLTVTMGEAFEIRDFAYAEGWKVSKQDRFSGNTIGGLVVTNGRDDDEPESPSLTFRFLSGSRVDGDISCYSKAPLRPDETTTMQCSGDLDEVVPGSTIEVYDTAYAE